MAKRLLPTFFIKKKHWLTSKRWRFKSVRTCVRARDPCSVRSPQLIQNHCFCCLSLLHLRSQHRSAKQRVYGHNERLDSSLDGRERARERIERGRVRKRERDRCARVPRRSFQRRSFFLSRFLFRSSSGEIFRDGGGEEPGQWTDVKDWLFFIQFSTWVRQCVSLCRVWSKIPENDNRIDKSSKEANTRNSHSVFFQF